MGIDDNEIILVFITVANENFGLIVS